MKPVNEIQQDLNKEASREVLKNVLGELALSHLDYLYNMGTPHEVSPDKDAYTEFLTKTLEDFESTRIFLTELLEVDQLLRKNDIQKYLNQPEVPANIGFYEACTLIKQWLQASPVGKYESLPKVKIESQKMLNAFAKFKLATQPENTHNPLSIAVIHGKMAVANHLLRAGAPSHVAMIQSAIDAKDLALIELLVNNFGTISTKEFMDLLNFNLNKQTIALTAEIVRALKVLYGKATGDKTPLNITPENFARSDQKLLKELAPYMNDASRMVMIQSAIDANNLELLQWLVNISETIPAYRLMHLLKSNLEKEPITLTAEMVRALKAPYAKTTQHTTFQLDKVADECFARLNSSLTQELYTYISSSQIWQLLIYAVKNESTELASAILSHPNFNSQFMNQLRYLEMPPQAQGSAHKGVAGLIFKAKFDYFCREAYGHLLVESRTDGIDCGARALGFTQKSLADYLLARAQDLPQTPQSIVLIQADLNQIKRTESNLHIFLRGTVIGRLRNKLVADLEGELAKREKGIQASANEGTSSRVTYQAPVPLSSTSALGGEDIELTDFNPERPKVNT